MPPGKNYKPLAVKALFALALFFALTINLESTPPLWWDEGWNLSVARNWVQLGHYGRLLDGELTSPAMSTGFPAIAPVALSFRVLGIGVWQARLVGVFFTLGALALVYYLANYLYGRSVAIATLGVLVLMSPHREIHPILMGRQILGEMPALFYLMAGFACFVSAAHGHTLLLIMTAFFWGIALLTKLGVLPFWIVSLLIPFLVSLYLHRWHHAILLMAVLFGSLIASQILFWLNYRTFSSGGIYSSSITGLYDVTAFVPVVSVRLVVLMVTLIFGLPTILGLCHAIVQVIRNQNRALSDIDKYIVRLTLLTLAASWFGWYLLLSIGWLRYFFPAIFIGSIFAAAFLHHVTDGFNLSSTIKRGGFALRHLRFNRESSGALLATVLIAMTFPPTLEMLYRSYVVEADTSAMEVADFFNTQTATNALIETYDSELFFFLNRRYHYPPDQIHVELNRRTFLGQDVPIDYDPLATNPDYLVVGPHSKLWRLYDHVLATGAFRLLRAYGGYDVYERER